MTTLFFVRNNKRILRFLYKVSLKNYNKKMTAYANAKDQDNGRKYLVADSSEEISKYCIENNLEIISEPHYVEPGMVCHHFDWVGNRRRPAIFKISRPYSK
jgi:hypothetical protein